MFTYGRLIKLIICIVLTGLLKVYVEMPAFMFFGFAVLILVEFDILKDKKLSLVVRAVSSVILIAVCSALIYYESGTGEELLYFASFSGGCLVWFVVSALYKKSRGKEY